MLLKPEASVGNEHPPRSPSRRIHSSGSHGPSEVVTYQIRVTSFHRIASRDRLGCSQAISSGVIISREPLETPGFGSHGSTRATRQHSPKRPATSQPDRSPSTIIATPPAVKTGDTTSVNALTASPSRRQESNASTSSLAESRIRPHVPCRGIGVQNSGGAGRDVENED